jgi:transcription termination/antitermination protein NusG
MNDFETPPEEASSNDAAAWTNGATTDTSSDAAAAPDAAEAEQTPEAADALPEWATMPVPSGDEEVDVEILRVDGASEDDAEELVDVAEPIDTAGLGELADAELLDVVEVDEKGEEVEAGPREPSPYDRPGDWFVVHTYAGYENKVKQNLASRVKSMNVEERIYEVVIPMEDVIEFKGGRKVVVQKKVFPGYLLVRMALDDDSWYVVRNTPGVTAFVGNASRPTPLSRKEVESILGVGKEEAGQERKVRPRLEFEVGEQVRVVAGPFADFNGAISDIDVGRSKLTVLVNIFGRETPVELELGQVAKL